ncbi:MAG: RNHCP domain-containing protein [Candidatus Paceibacterota bacterium]|jgi:DNA-directed RNA polymerase subunit RPC12/RpoP
MRDEDQNQEFVCFHCGRKVFFDKTIGTKHRNHCPYCLWSKHVDFKESGDRKSDCQVEMEPIGLTFKQEGINKYGKAKQGELMLIHKCLKCNKISINRLAADDNSQVILEVFEKSKQLNSEKINELIQEGIKILTEQDKQEIETQLFGKDI